jgi:hypothetical protein
MEPARVGKRERRGAQRKKLGDSDPIARPVNEVLEDVRSGLAPRERAWELYGVGIDAGMTVSESACRRLVGRGVADGRPPASGRRRDIERPREWAWATSTKFWTTVSES